MHFNVANGTVRWGKGVTQKKPPLRASVLVTSVLCVGFIRSSVQTVQDFYTLLLHLEIENWCVVYSVMRSGTLSDTDRFEMTFRLKWTGGLGGSGKRT